MDDEKVYRIDKRILEKMFKERLEPTPLSENISVDEVSYKKHHRYLTNVIDVDEKVVVWNAKGRKAKVLDEYYASLPGNGSKRIKTVALDGARTFISSTRSWAVNALIVLDRFHAVNKVNTALELVRKAELRQARKDENKDLIELTNCKQRFILLKKKHNLTERQNTTLAKLCQINEPIYKGLLLKEDFLSIYDSKDAVQAKERIDAWIDKARESQLQPFLSLAQSVTDKSQLILNWFKHRISSAISEGFNNKIKRLKRMAYGYRDIEYFKLKIHQHCGYLNPRRFSH
jgi:transposase